MPRYCLTFDLQDDPKKIAEYKRRHEKIWPEVRDSLYAAGVVDMEIYLTGTRLFMIMDVNDSFSLDKKAAMDLRQSQGAGVGGVDGGVPGRAGGRGPGAPLDAHGEGLRPRKAVRDSQTAE